MDKMLVLLSCPEIEGHVPELKEIAKTHGIAKVYLARVSHAFGSRVRSIVAPHKLDMAARMSDAAADRYLAQIADALREDGIDVEPISSIPAKKLDGFIKKNNIDLVLTSDGRSGLCRWPSGGLVGRHVQFLYEHASTADDKVELTSEERTKPYTKKMLVLLNRLDIEARLPELRDIAMAQGVKSVYLASAPGAFGSISQGIAMPQEIHPAEQVIVYLARVSRTFGSRVRSIVAPQKLGMAARISDAAASKYLVKIADALSKEGVEAVPIGIGISIEKVEEYIKKNKIELLVTGDGRSGLFSWPIGGLTGGNLRAIGYGFREEQVALERQKAKARYGLRTMSGIVLQFGALFLFWLVLSGHYQLKYILFGVASAALVTFLTHDLVSSLFQHDEKRTKLINFSQIWRFLTYLPWLLSRIVMANLQVAYLVLHPRMPIAPVLLQFRTRLQKNLARVIVANSITLTPGTITVSLSEEKYVIHALVPSSAGDILEAKLQNKVAEIFGEDKEEPPNPRWAHSLEELEP